jgi:hypothetical protein
MCRDYKKVSGSERREVYIHIDVGTVIIIKMILNGTYSKSM